MKTKLVKNIMAPLVVACALATGVNAGLPPRGGTEGGRLQGTWEMQITQTDCAGHTIRSFPSVVIFMAGGTMMESNANPSPALKTPGQGVWRHTADNNYAFSFKQFTFNAQGVFTGWVIIAGEATVDSTGDAQTGSATIRVYDTNGNLIVSICADTAGTRYEL